MIPEYCMGLWIQLIAADKGVRVHEQELTKASDVKTLFDLGLIRIVRDSTVFPAVDLVLSEYGEQLKSQKTLVSHEEPISRSRSQI